MQETKNISKIVLLAGSASDVLANVPRLRRHGFLEDAITFTMEHPSSLLESERIKMEGRQHAVSVVCSDGGLVFEDWKHMAHSHGLMLPQFLEHAIIYYTRHNDSTKSGAAENFSGVPSSEKMSGGTDGTPTEKAENGHERLPCAETLKRLDALILAIPAMRTLEACMGQRWANDAARVDALARTGIRQFGLDIRKFLFIDHV